MNYDSKNNNRQSVRLKNYDYSQDGFYFVTVCCDNKKHFFGEIINDEMVLNDAGKMIEKWYYELEKKFKDIKCQEMIVMPNHFHCIVQNVGADIRVCPNTNLHIPQNTNSHIHKNKISDTNLMPGEHTGSPLHRVVQWFKTMTTNEYIRNVKSNNWESFDGKLWQRNYYEHIIRNEKSYHEIHEYIKNNPINFTEN